MFDGYAFTGKIPLKDISQIDVSISVFIGNACITKKKLFLGKFFPITYSYKNSYYFKNGYVLTSKDHIFTISKCKNSKLYEKKFLAELKASIKKSDKKAYWVRKALPLLLKFKKKPIWLISDRELTAGDNGEAFFNYVSSKKKEINSYFVISDKSNDYDRLRKIGKVIPFNSHKHKLIHLLADNIVSSQGEDFIFNPFNKFKIAYLDYLANQKFIFLQHGVIKDDLSGWLNKYNKNIDAFITSTKPEYDSILGYNYYYNDRIVWLTGLPRFDYLYSDSQNKICIMPTWRFYLAHNKNKVLNSNYYNFYHSLMSHPLLLETAKKYGYKITLKPHPQMTDMIDLFINDNVEVLPPEVGYRDIYAQSNLIITDYSSAVFDFAYLGKPVVYCHFDYEEFTSGAHMYTKGYFDYEKDGFGEVEYDLESTVSRIIEYMENGCTLKDKYKERIDSTFAYRDKNNCERVFDKIIELNNQD